MLKNLQNIFIDTELYSSTKFFFFFRNSNLKLNLKKKICVVHKVGKKELVEKIFL